VLFALSTLRLRHAALSSRQIAEWSTKRGLAASTLMILRRSGGNAEGAISRQAAGLTFDFPAGDHNTCVAPTARAPPPLGTTHGTHSGRSQGNRR
jgi:hypothetical protein